MYKDLFKQSPLLCPHHSLNSSSLTGLLYTCRSRWADACDTAFIKTRGNPGQPGPRAWCLNASHCEPRQRAQAASKALYAKHNRNSREKQSSSFPRQLTLYRQATNKWEEWKAREIQDNSWWHKHLGLGLLKQTKIPVLFQVFLY